MKKIITIITIALIALTSTFADPHQRLVPTQNGEIVFLTRVESRDEFDTFVEKYTTKEFNQFDIYAFRETLKDDYNLYMAFNTVLTCAEWTNFNNCLERDVLYFLTFGFRNEHLVIYGLNDKYFVSNQVR